MVFLANVQSWNRKFQPFILVSWKITIINWTWEKFMANIFILIKINFFSVEIFCCCQRHEAAGVQQFSNFYFVSFFYVKHAEYKIFYKNLFKAFW